MLKPNSIWTAAICGLIVLLGQGALALTAVKMCGGHFVYTLDDPYIHLALARQISLGHYGLNPGEASAPSSSALWPFLLALFAHATWFEYAPLVLNGSACAASAAAIALCWSEAIPDSWSHRQPKIVLLTAITVLASNGVAIGLTGMEHGLQLLLTNLAALGLIWLAKYREVPPFLLAALILAPLVRYENLALTGATAAVLFLSRHRRAAVLCFASPVAILAGFSFFLHAQGLGWLPTSVLAKTGANAAQPTGTELMVFGAILGVVAIAARATRAAPILAVAAVATLAHAKFASTGWLERYEVYLYSFGLIALGFAWSEWAPAATPRVRALGLALPAMLVYYVGTTPYWVLCNSAEASACVYRQQFQTMRFVRDYYQAPVACNDIGIVAFDSGQTVLDLWGLASLEALHARTANLRKDWAGPVVSRHRVGLVVIYDRWIPVRPTSWTLIATLTETIPTVAIGDRTVSIYATPDADLPTARAAFARFSRTVPDGVFVHIS